MKELHHRVATFQAGNISKHAEAWKKLTGDKFIIDIVTHGLLLNFHDNYRPSKYPFQYPRGKKETDVINKEISDLLRKGVICISPPMPGDYFSNLFTREKKDGTMRTILNLKYLNEECDTHHFKMETLKQALHMIQPNSYLASIDIKDAFYSVPIHPDHRKYLKFMWSDISLQFDVMPNGYRDAMRVFTKLLKPVFSSLRKKGFTSVI